MAEAAVEDRPSLKFYCHMCNVQFQTTGTNFTCPHCADGFVEEMQETDESSDEMMDFEEWEDEEDPRGHTRSDAGGSIASGGGVGANRTGRRYANSSNRARIVRPRTLTRLASSNLRQHVPFDNLIHDFIINLGVNIGATGNMQVFLGNPGDYAWGREGLDAIVTQLLNQMDSTGPPPVSKEIIDALPVVEVTEEQVAGKLQCSVCWEDFSLMEKVRQLPCSHIYHEPCIRPWLNLHGTCPICRQNLVHGADREPTPGADSDAGSSSSGNFSTFRNIFAPNTTSNPSSSSSNLNDSGSTRSRSHSDSMM